MTLTLLLDLDDTLLDTHLETFMPVYFQALAEHFGERVTDSQMFRGLIGGMSQMNDNSDPRRTLEDVFDAFFYPSLGIPKREVAESLDYFYDSIFPGLGVHTQKRQDAIEFVEWAFERGHQIAIATDPLFPRKATYHRLCWAGFDPNRFALFSAYEDFHFSKHHPAYYAEVLGRLGWQDGGVLMVGNDATRDVLCAHRLGLKTFLIETESASSDGVEAGRGSLSDLRKWLEVVDESALEPSFKTRESVLGIIQSTPAILQGLLKPLSPAQQQHEPTLEDWALNEIVCHLRDTEREVHAEQLSLLLEKNDAFIPRPDTGVWSNERDYLHESAEVALREFANARVEMLLKLKHLSDDVWNRKARHAIFGPTNFFEVLSFVADHDRLHLQQAWKTLQSV